MADKVFSLTVALCVICCILPCLQGDGHPGYVPIGGGGKVGVPLTPSFAPPSVGVEAAVVVEEGEMIETAASDLESEANLDEWEDESQLDEGNQEQRVVDYAAPPSGRGLSPRANYIDMMLGRAGPHARTGLVMPADIGLTMIPTGMNRTSQNSTAESKTARKIMCVGRNLTENDTAPAVKLVNNTGLLSMLGLKNDSSSPNCAIVMFYAPWCPFCSKTAPHYNALARAFPQLNVLAIDAVHFSNLNARFGTVAVPNILIFHNAKAVARFNASMRTLNFMVDFVSNITGLTPTANVTVEELDLEGPLPSRPTQEPDYLLFLSWAFVLSFVFYVFANSALGQRLYQSLATFGREPEHQHID